MNANSAIWLISIATIALVIIRPFKLRESTLALAGALALLITRLISPAEAYEGIVKGTDVYLFLTGMMLLAETAREEKLFDWMAAWVTHLSKGSAKKLFILIYIAGTVVTIFLSNDATAVVLTPAVAATMRSAKVKQPLPFLFTCAFVANAASFVLPISNPANLVIYGQHLPPLFTWLRHFILPSIASIGVTYLMLFLSQKKYLQQPIEPGIEIPRLSKSGRAAGWGIGATAIVLLTVSAFDMQLGLPTAITGIITSLIVIIIARKSPVEIIKGVSWSVLPFVAGLFIIVEALIKTGLISNISSLLAQHSKNAPTLAAFTSGIGIALASNVTNNLPSGLIAGSVLRITANLPILIKNAVLIGVDLGPNLSVSGSLATILWLVALRREGIEVSPMRFFKIGLWVMLPALLLALAALLI